MPRHLLLIALFAVPLFLVSFPSAPAQETEGRLAVHEWGTFTSFLGSDGVHLEFRPLIGADLPSFVYTEGGRPNGLRLGPRCEACPHFGCRCGPGCSPTAEGDCQCKSCLEATVRMETPVLYFHSDRERDVRVAVEFPGGRITEWYPQAREVEGGGLDWGWVRVLPGADAELRREEAPSHYYPARRTAAALVRVRGIERTEFERFLFYRGVGRFEQPLAVTARDGDRFEIENRGPDDLGPAYVIECAGRTRWHRSAPTAPGERRTLSLEGASDDADGLGRALVADLVALGLDRDEAEAMLATWRSNWFGEEGTRVLYLIGTGPTGRFLPLTIEPRPTELVRVLVGRLEILTPGRAAAVEAEIARLGAGRFEDREAATATLAAFGRFAIPSLERVREATDDPEIRRRIDRLLEGLTVD